MMKNAKEYVGKDTYSMDDFVEIMKLLRIGCPWDRVQTHTSIRQNFIEEVYEAVDAIDKNDKELLCEELGDVLMQVIFHTLMCEEDGDFTLSDVLLGVCRKLIVRHPHIFSDVKAEDADTVLTNWDAIKQKTKNQKSVKETVEDIPKSLPSLMRAQKTAKRASKGEYKLSNRYESFSKEEAERKIGEELFEICSAAQSKKLDAEGILHKYCNEFLCRMN